MLSLSDQQDLQEIGYSYALTEFWLKMSEHTAANFPELDVTQELEHAQKLFKALEKTLQTLEPDEYSYMLKGYDDIKRKLERVFCVKDWQ